MKLDVALDAPVYLVKGDDDVLLGDAVLALVHDLVGDGDRSLMVEELTIERYEREREGDARIGPVVDAARTMPFLTDRRVVVARHVGAFSTTESVAPLIEYLAEPLDTTALVLVWERVPRPGTRLPRIPTKLGDAVKGAGGVVVETGAGTGKARDQWFDQQLQDAPVRLTPDARRRLQDQIGEDASQLVGLLPTLAAVYGEGATVDAEALAPYLGQEGGVKPFELTDAIDQGDVPLALDRLHRLMAGGGWHPLQVMASLTNHVTRMVALDGSGVGDEKAAAELLGMKGSTYPARKALTQCRALGSERLAELTRLLAQADLDLRGAKAWPPELVVEVLVARMASRAPRGRSSARSTGRSRSRARA
jgi:DNA polymerase-3 subunit delta